jgi:hypothetical protein
LEFVLTGRVAAAVLGLMFIVCATFALVRNIRGQTEQFVRVNGEPLCGTPSEAQTAQFANRSTRGLLFVLSSRFRRGFTQTSDGVEWQRMRKQKWAQRGK